MGTRNVLRVDRLVEKINGIDGFDSALKIIQKSVPKWENGVVNSNDISKTIGDFLYLRVLNSNLPEREKIALTSFFINESYKVNKLIKSKKRV